MASKLPRCEGRQKTQTANEKQTKNTQRDPNTFIPLKPAAAALQSGGLGRHASRQTLIYLSRPPSPEHPFGQIDQPHTCLSRPGTQLRLKDLAAVPRQEPALWTRAACPRHTLAPVRCSQPAGEQCQPRLWPPWGRAGLSELQTKRTSTLHICNGAIG